MVKKTKGNIKSSYLPEEVLYMGFGLASMAKEQLSSFSSFLIKEGKLLAKDKAKFRKELAQKGEKYYKTMMKNMEKASSSVIEKMNMPTRKEFEALKKVVEKQNKQSKTKKK